MIAAFLQGGLVMAATIIAAYGLDALFDYLDEEITSGCRHSWCNSARIDGMLPNTWIQQCRRCGVYEDGTPS